MRYRILGADGREYGPVTADQVREWITEGRANAQTRALDEGTAQWKPLTEYAEFALILARAMPPLPAPGPISIAPTPRNNAMAVMGMVMGILSITCGMCCCYGLPFNVLGIVFSLVALVPDQTRSAIPAGPAPGHRGLGALHPEPGPIRLDVDARLGAEHAKHRAPVVPIVACPHRQFHSRPPALLSGRTWTLLPEHGSPQL